MVQIVVQRGRIYCQTRDQPVLHLTGKGDGHVVVRQYGHAVIQEFLEGVACVRVGLSTLLDEPLYAILRNKKI